ncbi:MAG TPA: hypothetical protein VMH05_07685, partial [Bryobacteraceae bacterium]|nr:hypothetical protein [Bryobacteraceae bacterium]
APVSIPRLAAARADTSTMLFALALAVVNGILFGLAPALRIAGGRIAGTARQGVRLNCEHQAALRSPRRSQKS